MHLLYYTYLLLINNHIILRTWLKKSIFSWFWRVSDSYSVLNSCSCRVLLSLLSRHMKTTSIFNNWLAPHITSVLAVLRSAITQFINNSFETDSYEVLSVKCAWPGLSAGSVVVSCPSEGSAETRDLAGSLVYRDDVSSLNLLSTQHSAQSYEYLLPIQFLWACGNLVLSLMPIGWNIINSLFEVCWC